MAGVRARHGQGAGRAGAVEADGDRRSGDQVTVPVQLQVAPTPMSRPQGHTVREGARKQDGAEDGMPCAPHAALHAQPGEHSNQSRTAAQAVKSRFPPKRYKGKAVAKSTSKMSEMP